jgi:hypothetical protein
MKTTTVELLTRQPPDGRGCGSRDEEKPYLCTGTSAEGLPIENFLIDPPLPLPPDGWHRGFEIRPRDPKDPDSINDVIIFIGSEAYPAAWDFVEESRHFGVSRKVSPDFPFEQLSPDSRMIFAHKQAIPTFAYELVAYRQQPAIFCKCHDPNVQTPTIGLNSVWSTIASGWHPRLESEIRSTPCTTALQDLAFLAHDDHGDRPAEYGLPARFTIERPSLNYGGFYPHMDDTEHAEFEAGLFLALPLTHIEFKNKPHEAAQTKAQAAGFRTEVLPW